MTPDSFASPIATSHRMPWLDRTAPLGGIFCAGFTGSIFSAVLNSHCWGPAGRPGWAAHSGAIALAVALGLSLLALGCAIWTTWWAARVPAMARDRFRGWYLWSAILGIPVGLALGRLTVWLIHVQRVPSPALDVILLGTVATVMTSCMIGYYRLQGLARTQRDLLVQAQLAPHFLFNSLSTLKAQIADEPLEAQATADRLSRLFRELMDLGSQSTVPLARELAFVEGGLLTIRACRVCPNLLQLIVSDPGTGESPNPGSGRGLKVLRARLARPSDLAFESLPGGQRGRGPRPRWSAPSGRPLPGHRDAGPEGDGAGRRPAPSSGTLSLSRRRREALGRALGLPE